MKWTRAKLENYLYEDEDTLGPGGREGCIGYLEHINDFLTENKLHSTVDLMSIVDGTFWGKIKEKKRLLTIKGKCFGRPWSGCFEDFLDGLNQDFQRGIISDEYKFKKIKLPSSGYVSTEIAAKYLGLTVRRIEQLADEGKLEFRRIRNDTVLQIEVDSLKEFKRNR